MLNLNEKSTMYLYAFVCTYYAVMSVSYFDKNIREIFLSNMDLGVSFQRMKEKERDAHLFFGYMKVMLISLVIFHQV